MNQLKVSVVTCTWNSAATLTDTIDSVQQQSYRDVEHIFVDGGSTDGTIEMIRARCPSARLLTDITGGISRAMNAGIAAAGGDVVSHLHSDDFYADASVLDRVTTALQQSHAHWALGSMDTLCDGVRRPAPRGSLAFSPARYARGSVAIHHPAVFIRRDVFGRVGMFDERLRYAMDIDLWFRIGAHFNPVELNATLAVFRVHAGSLSSAQSAAARREEWQVRRRYMARWPLDTLVCGLRHGRMALRNRRPRSLTGLT